MKLLILVLSSRNEPYINNIQCSKETWDKPNVENVETIYFTGRLPNERFKQPQLKDKVLKLPVSDAYNMMHWKFKKALNYVWDMEWDYIFRSNASTYIRKHIIYDKIKELPKEGVYAGLDGGGFVSGTGVILSRDTAKIIKDNFDENIIDSEDCAMGSLLVKHNIRPQQYLERLNFNFAEDKILEADYWRCKSEIPDDVERKGDLMAFRKLFEYEKSNIKPTGL